MENKRMHRAPLFLILCVCLVLGIGALHVNAAQKDAAETDYKGEAVTVEYADVSEYVLQEGGLLPEKTDEEADYGIASYRANSADVPQTMADTEDEVMAYVKEVLTEGWAGFSEEIYINGRGYGLYANDLTIINEAYFEILNEDYRFFYVSSSWAFAYYADGSIAYIKPIYTMTKAEAEEGLIHLEDAINECVSGVDSSWSDMEKALYLNDYLARTCEYDFTYTRYTAYDALVEKTAVCQGYTLAYSALASQVGLSTEIVTSNTLNHAWNLVKVGNDYYNIDVTWNDATPDRLGQVKHSYFLKSSSYFNSSAGGHAAKDWSFSGSHDSSSASKTTYDSYFWDSVNTGFEYIDGTWYAIDGTTLDSYTCNGTKFTEVKAIKNLTGKEYRWYVWGSASSYYTGCYAGLASHGSMLYYSTPTIIYEYNPATGITQEEYTLSDAYAARGYIYGLGLVDADSLDIYLATGPNTGDGVGIYEIERLAHVHHIVHYAAKAASCEDGNIEYWHCSGCDTYYSDEALTKEIRFADTILSGDASLHVPVTDAAVEPSCEVIGLTEGSHCSVCETVLTEQEEIPAAGHKEEKLLAVAPTCISDGLTQGSWCPVCGKVFVAQEVIPASHTETISKSGRAAACTVDGLTDEVKCKVCGVILEAQEVIPAGHTPVTDKAVAATATKTGLTEGSHCSVCGEILVAQEVIPALGVPAKGSSYTEGDATYTVTTTGSSGGTVKVSKVSNTATKVTIPSSIKENGLTYKVTSIAKNAFKGDKKLKSVVIDSHITHIGKKAFYGCKNLKKITIKSTHLTKKSVGAKAFKGIHKKAVIKVPKSKFKSYKKILKARGVGKKAKYKKIKG